MNTLLSEFEEKILKNVYLIPYSTYNLNDYWNGDLIFNRVNRFASVMTLHGKQAFSILRNGKKQRRQKISNTLNLRITSVAKIVKNLKKSGSFTDDKSTVQISTIEVFICTRFPPTNSFVN